MSASTLVSSACGPIALLYEKDHPALQAAALSKLYSIVDDYWAEIADAVPLLEALAEDETFSAAPLAAALASKCFFHLEAYDDSLRLALGAQRHFDVQAVDAYTQTLLAACLDRYTCARQQDSAVDERMEDIVNRLFDRCLQARQYEQALGMALETRRLDALGRILKAAANQPSLLDYALQCSTSMVKQKAFRIQVLELLVQAYESQTPVHYLETALCYVLLGKADKVAAILQDCWDANHKLLAYQIAFDVVEADGALARRLPVPTLTAILNGTQTRALHLHFYYHACASDPLLMERIHSTIESQRNNSVLHHAVVVAHAYTMAGTTRDGFLRSHLNWLGKAVKWAKFSATASLGVIHARHVNQSQVLLAPYLPGPVSAAAHSEGGALFALGLIHESTQDDTIAQILHDAIERHTEQPVLHGAALGLGVLACGSAGEQAVNRLQGLIERDGAVAGDGAALALGLVTLGAAADHGSICTMLYDYAQDTEHEKIVRSAIVALALQCAGTEDDALPWIERLQADSDPVIRYGAMFVIGLAYVGTGAGPALERVLHIAVSDVNDDVRRAAVMVIGFILCRNPSTVPTLVSLLAASYNPHVRYGAAMAVGIAAAGSNQKEALDLLKPLRADGVDYVRQGALLATALVVMNDKAVDFRKELDVIVQDKHATTMTKMGALLASGIVDMAGRQAVLSLTRRHGLCNLKAVAGITLWLQHWYWYPCLHFLPLALEPTALLGLQGDLQLPTTFAVTCHTKPSMFALPDLLVPDVEKKKELVATAVLSTTAKAAAKAAQADETAKQNETAMEVDRPAEEQKEDDKKEDDKKEEKKEEPESFIISNGGRMIKAQESFCSVLSTSRYQPVVSNRRSGIVLLQDGQPGEKEELREVADPLHVEEEAEAPADFEWQVPAS